MGGAFEDSVGAWGHSPLCVRVCFVGFSRNMVVTAGSIYPALDWTICRIVLYVVVVLRLKGNWLKVGSVRENIEEAAEKSKEEVSLKDQKPECLKANP